MKKKLQLMQKILRKKYAQHDHTLLNAGQVAIPGVQNFNGLIYGLRTDSDKVAPALTGLLFGKDAVYGYHSANNNNMSIKDIYQNGGLRRKILGGLIGGGAVGAALGTLAQNDFEHQIDYMIQSGKYSPEQIQAAREAM